MGRALGSVNLAGPPASVLEVIAEDVSQGRVSLAEVYRVEDGTDPRRLVPVIDVAASTVPRNYSAAAAMALAQRAASGGGETAVVEQLAGGGNLVRSAVPIRGSATSPVRGVIIASEYLTGGVAARARRMTAAYEDYQQLQVLK